MSESIYTPYFYIIRHKASGKRYAGCRYAKGCHPSDLLVEYFTSSNVVGAIIENDGKDSFEVVEIVSDIDDVLSYESEFLQKHDCAGSDDWLNLHNGYGSWRWEDLSQEAKQRSIDGRVSAWNGKSEEEKNITRKKMSETRKGVLKSEEHKRNLSKSHMGKTFSAESRAKMSKAKSGRIISDDQRAKQRATMKTLKWWNNGEICTRAKECPGPEWTGGRL